MRKLETASHVAWDEVGQVVEGTVLKLEMTTGKMQGKILRLQTEEGIITVSAPTLLAQQLEDNWSDVQGKFVRITFASQDKPSAKNKAGMKRFDVEVDDSENGGE